MPPPSAQTPTPPRPVAVLGAGLAGLCCATELQAAHIPVILIEQSDAAGGRMRTDHLDGFLLDRGFQVFLTAYPTAKAVLDYPALDLCPFEPGAQVFAEGAMQTMLDPWRRPGSLIDGALAKVGTLADKLRVGAMRARLQRQSEAERFAKPETTILAALTAEGFSPTMIDRFFRPFFGGIFFDTDLAGSSRMMDFVFKCFSLGDAAVPRLGMQQIPQQLVARLAPGTLRLNTRVEAIDGQHVHCVSKSTGQRETLETSAIVNAATDCLFLPRAQGVPGQHDRSWKSVTNIYFAGTGEPPIKGPILVLDGERSRRGPAANVVCMSNVSSAYAPAGSFLLSCSLIGLHGTDADTVAEDQTRAQLAHWFGPTLAASLRHLRTYRIDKALPDQTAPYYTRQSWPSLVRPGLYAAGDTHDTASIDGAMASGLRAAREIIADFTHTAATTKAAS